jgi:palmitoyltransferase
VLAISHLWQVSRQMTTLEVSNLGRYGYMGERGSSLRDQAGAMQQAMAIGAGVGPTGAAEDGVAMEGSSGPGGNLAGVGDHGHVHGPGCKHGRGHSHGVVNTVRSLGKMCAAPFLQISGLDRFTKGQALGGMRRAGRDQNPFDLGPIRVSPSRLSENVALMLIAGAISRTARTFGSVLMISTIDDYTIYPRKVSRHCQSPVCVLTLIAR